MTLYEKNMKCLMQNCQYVDYTNPRSGSFSLFVEKSARGCLTASAVTEESGGKKAYLHSRYNPLKESVEFADGIMGEPSDNGEPVYDCTALIMGVGLGYHLSAVLNRLSERGRLIVVEPDTSFFLDIIKHIDLTGIFSDERVYFMLGKSPEELRIMLVDYFDLFKAHSMAIGILQAYKILFPQAVASFNSAVKAVKQNIGFVEFISFERGGLTVQNFASIIPDLSTSLDYRNFIGKLKNVPCVIVTAGPSLDKNIEELHSMRGRAFVICVYTALAPLLRHGITPDVVISTDAKQLIREAPAVKLERYNIPLIHVPSSPKELLQKFTGVKILCLTPMDEYLLDVLRKLKKLRINKAENFIRLGGSVACSAIDFAVCCGCGPIIFVGLDLAYAPGDKTHAAGTSYDYTDKAFLKRFNLQTTIGLNGGQVTTADVLTVYRKWIEKYIALDKTGRIYVDATEGGALIEGTEIEDLRTAKRKYMGTALKENLLEDLFNSGKMFTCSEYDFLLSDISETLNEYKVFARRLKKRIEKLLELQNLGDIAAYRQMLADTDDYIIDINSKLKLFSLLVNSAYISADKIYVDRLNKFYMNSFDFKLSFYRILADLILGNILTFRSFMPISNTNK